MVRYVSAEPELGGVIDIGSPYHNDVQVRPGPRGNGDFSLEWKFCDPQTLFEHGIRDATACAMRKWYNQSGKKIGGDWALTSLSRYGLHHPRIHYLNDHLSEDQLAVGLHRMPREISIITTDGEAPPYGITAAFPCVLPGQEADWPTLSASVPSDAPFYPLAILLATTNTGERDVNSWMQAFSDVVAGFHAEQPA